MSYACSKLSNISFSQNWKLQYLPLNSRYFLSCVKMDIPYFSIWGLICTCISLSYITPKRDQNIRNVNSHLFTHVLELEVHFSHLVVENDVILVFCLNVFGVEFLQFAQKIGTLFVFLTDLLK